MTKGIDISEFQNNINYDKLKADGIEFVIIRCGYGKNENQKDALFEQHYANCRRVGLKVGAYLFSYASTEEGARLEAENCLRFIQGKEFDLPIFYDVEDNNTTGAADKYTITKMCEIFCNRIISAGYQAGVYASLYWFTDKMYVEELEKYNIWLAQWNNEITANFNVDIWQYTNNYDDMHIDGNYLVNENILVENGDNSVNKPNIEELAQAVIRGEYGNGQERKDKLGSLYNEVQARVNEILLGNKPNIEELAQAVIRGEYGNGQERKDRLGSLYNEVQARVNEILLG